MEIEKTKKRKIFGTPKNNVEITESKVQSQHPVQQKKYSVWNDALTQQKKLLDLEVNTQFIPLDILDLDPQNARQISITLNEIRNAPKLNNAVNLSEDFEKSVNDFFSEKDPISHDVKVNEYLSLAQLASSINRPDNLIHPILVYMEEGRFKLIAGHRRSLAHHIMGVDVIFAKILPIKPDAIEKSVLQWKENHERKNLSLYEKLLFIDSLTSAWSDVTGEKVNIPVLMSLLSFRKTMASYFVSVLSTFKSNEKFRTAIEMDILNNIKSASNIAKLQSEAQNRMLDMLIQGHPIEKQGNSDKLDVGKKKSSGNIASSFGLKITKDTRLSPISAMLKKLMLLPEVSDERDTLSGLNLNKKEDVIVAWKILYDVFDSNKD
jgi:hypothetical protein